MDAIYFSPRLDVDPVPGLWERICGRSRGSVVIGGWSLRVIIWRIRGEADRPCDEYVGGLLRTSEIEDGSCLFSCRATVSSCLFRSVSVPAGSCSRLILNVLVPLL